MEKLDMILFVALLALFAGNGRRFCCMDGVFVCDCGSEGCDI